jgi:hypothetical protein
MLQNSASTLNQLAVRDKNTNEIKSFKGSEANFRKKVQETIDTYNTLIEKKENLM